MTKQVTVRIALTVSLLFLVTLAPVIAQEAEAQSDEVFTNKELKERLDAAEAPQVVFTNADLKADEPAEEADEEASDDAESEEAEAEPEPAPAPAPQPTPGVFTNADLKADEPAEEDEQEPAEEPAPAAPQAAPGVFTNDDLEPLEEPAEEEEVEEIEAEAATAEAAAARDSVPPPAAEPQLSAAERAEQIAEIDAQLKRLEKRLLAIRNPLLAGTVPSTNEETEAEAGMNNVQRVRLTEEKIEELRETLNELGADGE